MLSEGSNLLTPGSEIPRPLRPLRAAAPRRLLCRTGVLVPLLFLAGCASWHRPLPIPPEVSDAAVTARVLISPDLNVNPAETVIKPDDPSQRSPDPLPSGSPEAKPTIFALGDAIAFALRNNPRLRSARAAIERARGQEQVAFAPFLPQIDLLGQYGVTSHNLAPGIPGARGIPPGDHARDPQLRAKPKLALEWTLYDFGRTGGRYRQAVARERIAELQLVRADQTVAFDVAAAYLDVLLARASRRVQEDAIRRAEAILDDTVARRKGGVVDARGRAACRGATVGEPRGPRAGPGRGVRRRGPPEQRHGAQRRLAVGGDRPGGAAAVAWGAGRPPGAGGRPAPGGRPGPASGGGRPGGPASRPGRVPAADLRPGRRGTIRTGRTWLPAGRRGRACTWRRRSTPAAGTAASCGRPMRTSRPPSPTPRPSWTPSASR